MYISKRFLNSKIQERSLNENYAYKFSESGEYDVFVSYSYNDRLYAKRIVQLLEKCGYSAYIDLDDKALDRSQISRETALHLADIMQKCKGLIYIHSPNATLSKWCPWELGYFSGNKNFMCSYLPLLDNPDDSFPKQEYLSLYPYVDFDTVANSSKEEFWVCDNKDTYISLRQWLLNNKPYKRK